MQTDWVAGDPAGLPGGDDSWPWTRILFWLAVFAGALAIASAAGLLTPDLEFLP